MEINLLMNELASQVRSLKEYQNMNVIAKGSLGKAFRLARNWQK
jgi:hypothetical protein